MQSLNVPALLRDFGLHAKKSLGQNFLVDEAALRRVASAADLRPDETVLEIGPGVGSLTRHLAETAAQVIAVELDEALLPALRQVLQPYGNVRVVMGDILSLPRPAFVPETAYAVVANIPYYITAAILRRLLAAPPRPTRLTLTVQKEVADRLCAQPGALSLLAVSVQFYARPRRVAVIPAGAFYPRPQVDSAVVRLDVLPQPAVSVPDEETFFRVVKAGFSQKRKQLHNALAGGLALPGAQARALLLSAGIDPAARAETLTLADWGRLAWAYPASRNTPT